MVATATAAPASENQAKTPSANGRDSNGRFTKGNRGGPGNPFARQVAELRKALLNRLTGEEMAQVADALLDKAKEGDVAAAKLLFSYALGKPLDGLNPDQLDRDEWQVWQGEAYRSHDVSRVVHAINDEVPLEEVREVRQQKTDEYNRLMAERFTTEEREIREEAYKRACAFVIKTTQVAEEQREARAKAGPSPIEDNGQPPSYPWDKVDFAPSPMGGNGQPSSVSNEPKKARPLSYELKEVLNRVVLPRLEDDIKHIPRSGGDAAPSTNGFCAAAG